MKLNISKKNLILLNTVVFILCCVLFLHVIVSLSNDVSAFNFSYLKQNMMRFRLIGIIALTSLYAVWLIKKWSNYLILLLVSLITFEGFLVLKDDFNKLILLMMFLFIVVSYYFYQFWNSELNEPYYNPNFSDKDMFPPMLQKIKCAVLYDDNTYNGYLTNWNEGGAFVFLNNSPEKEVHSIILQVTIEGKSFEQKAEIVSRDSEGNGIGIKFNMHDFKGSKEYNWFDFFEVANDLGYNPLSIR
jgi:hypothetical protein